MKKSFLTKIKAATALVCSAALALGIIPAIPEGSQPVVEAEAASSVSHVSVHDPSIVKGDNGYYYIFGSHRAFAKSKDLQNWTTFDLNISYDYANVFSVGSAWAATNNSSYDLSGNLWAPDVIYNTTMKKWCMYMSINGSDFNSSIAMCTADSIEGPYTYAGTVVYSGFTSSTHPVSMTDYYKVCGSGASISRYLTSSGKWNSSYGTNAIDPTVFYDVNGNLWMVYGSWFGGIFTLKLSNSTGLRDYNTTYSLDTDASDGKASDPYMGSRIAGGLGSSGEAPYIEHIGNYYYLFVTYGGLDSNGGYNTRVFRSKRLNGPYTDAAGNYATYTTGTGISNTYGTVGIRMMSYYQLSGMSTGQIAGGHNSILTDSDGKIYNVYHTRFDDGYEFHEVRVHQLIMNKNGWPCEVPYEYAGETVSESGYSKSEYVGTYEWLIQKPGLLTNDSASSGGYNVIKSETVTLNSDGTITGAVDGKWSYTSGTPYITITLDGNYYYGVFTYAYDENTKAKKMTFSVVGKNNVCIWGAKGTGINTYTTTSITDGGTYYLRNVESGLFLDVSNASSANGTNIQQWTFNGLTAQKFQFKKVGNYYAILTGASDYNSCVDVTSGSFESGTNIEQWEYWGGDMQLFRVVQNTDGTYSFLTKVSSETQALDDENLGTTDGTNVDQWAFWGGDCQKWELVYTPDTYTTTSDMTYNGTYYIQSVSSGLYLDVVNGSSNDGTNIQQYAYNGSDAQKFKLVGVGGGYYALLTACSDYKSCVEVEAGSTSDGANIDEWSFWGGTMQYFKVIGQSDGSVCFTSWCSDGAQAIDVYNWSTSSGGNIDQWSYWAGDCQKFKLIGA